MNTTRNISIGGYAFIIDEDAYVRLSTYMGEVRKNLSGAPGTDEIMADIEVRIAEILRDSKKSREVLVSSDVAKVISIMGDPEVYVQDDVAGNKEKKESFTEEETSEKQMHRDPNNKILGGVCGGLGAYFNIDPVWFRLAFVITLFFYSISFLLYIILWIVIPEAKTRLQKLQMRGKKPDLKNIQNSIRSEINEVGDNMNRMANNKSVRDGISRFMDVLGEIFTRIFQVIGYVAKWVLKVLAGVFSIVCLVFLVSLVLFMITGATAIHFTGQEINVKNMSGALNHIFDSRLETDLFRTFIFLFLAVPTIALLVNSIRYLANIQTKTSKWVSLAAVGIWLMATSGLLYSGIRLIIAFSNTSTGKTEEVIPMKPNQVLHLRLAELPRDFDGFAMSDISLDIHESPDSLFYLRMYKEASGRDKAEADRRQKQIDYKPIIADSVLTFPDLILLPKGETVRAQSVMMELRVPRNRKIFIEPDMERLFNGIDNVQNLHDSEMPKKYWIMTELGLSCQGCAIPKADASDDDTIPDTDNE